MKNTIIITFLLSMFSAISQDSKKITESFQVSGNCEMCEKNIEEALLVKGVKSAEWDVKTHILKVTFVSGKITLDEIHNLVAKSGYDTEKVKADSLAYKNLPDCCQYTRK